MPQISFGPGSAWGERIDVTGSGIGPVQFGIMQDIQIDCDFTAKELYGQKQYAVAIARGQGKVTGKIKYAQVIAEIYSDLFLGVSSTVGQFGVSQFEAATVPAATPFSVTVANASTYNDDLGVTYAATGAKFTRVTTPSAAGQYAVNFATGVYTFSAADANAALLISYTFNQTSGGSLLTLQNQLSGTTPYFKMTFYQKVSPPVPGSALIPRPLALRLNACTANKLSLPAKVDEFTIQELDFMAFADAADVVGTWSTVE